MDVVLKVLEGAKQGAKIAVKKAEFIIGRSQSCHLSAGSSAISRQHCAILRDENRVTVKDLGSRNGTLINGHKISEETELVSGDELSVGPLKFLVTITAGIANAKRAGVKSVAEAVARTAEHQSGEVDVDDISNWLLAPSAPAMTETQTIRIDDTNAIQQLRKAAEEQESLETLAAADAETTIEESTVGKGKLPPVPPKPMAKDSREAAAEALRAWNRRR
jgi:pSer/pThr/pTyr-binding forkhead associated (FHA) protein